MAATAFFAFLHALKMISFHANVVNCYLDTKNLLYYNQALLRFYYSAAIFVVVTTSLSAGERFKHGEFEY